MKEQEKIHAGFVKNNIFSLNISGMQIVWAV